MADCIRKKGGEEIERMSDVTLNRLIEYLKKIDFSDSDIVELLDYITSK